MWERKVKKFKNLAIGQGPLLFHTYRQILKLPFKSDKQPWLVVFFVWHATLKNVSHMEIIWMNEMNKPWLTRKNHIIEVKHDSMKKNTWWYVEPHKANPILL
jgi:hypothetical protein